MAGRLLVLAALGTVAITLAGCGDGGGGGADVTAQEIILDLQPVGDAGATGTVSISRSGERTNVFVDVLIPSGGGEQPANIHTGTCAKFDTPPQYEIGNLQEGTGAATLDVPVGTLLDSPHAIVVKKSPAEEEVVIACAEVAAG